MSGKTPLPPASICQTDFFKGIRHLNLSAFYALSIDPEKISSLIPQDASVNHLKHSRIFLAFTPSAPALGRAYDLFLDT
jgi:hypothetical protein